MCSLRQRWIQDLANLKDSVELVSPNRRRVPSAGLENTYDDPVRFLEAHTLCQNGDSGFSYKLKTYLWAAAEVSERLTLDDKDPYCPNLPPPISSSHKLYAR